MTEHGIWRTLLRNASKGAKSWKIRPSCLTHPSEPMTLSAQQLFMMPSCPIGAKRIYEPELPEGAYAIAYGKQFPEFWINTPHDNKPAETENGNHFAFLAPSKEAVHAFWDAALQAGATPEGGTWPATTLRRSILRLLHARLGWPQD